MADTEEVWAARNDSDSNNSFPTACELQRVTDGEEVYYELSMTEGLFSGYPTIELHRHQLEDLRDKIVAELEKVRFCPNCSGRHKDASSEYCQNCGTRIRKAPWVRYEAT
jgi:tRNA(Ile2) C34 agmatinyltransferase TiaS